MIGKAKPTVARGMHPNAEPNVVPFIDVMLCLLIIFMVAAPMPTVDLKVDMPKPGPLVFQQQEDQSTIIKLVDANGVSHIYVQDELVGADQLDERLIAIVAARNPSQRGSLRGLFSEAKIYIDADQQTAYDNVVSLINQVDEVGFKKVNLLVKSAET